MEKKKVKTKLMVIIVVGVMVSGIFGTLFYLDQPKTPWDCRMKHGKVKEAIQDCLDRLQITEPKILENFHNNQPLQSKNPNLTEFLGISRR